MQPAWKGFEEQRLPVKYVNSMKSMETLHFSHKDVHVNDQPKLQYRINQGADGHSSEISTML